jgi:hypothetical protein
MISRSPILNRSRERVSWNSASKRKATAPEPSVDPPAAFAKSMVSANVDIRTNANRWKAFLAIGISRINLTVPNSAQRFCMIASSSGSGSCILTVSKGLRLLGIDLIF